MLNNKLEAQKDLAKQVLPGFCKERQKPLV